MTTLRHSIFLLVLLLAFRIFAKDKHSPFNSEKEWRIPNKEELEDEWRDKDPSRFTSVTGDFDGDKRIDQAMILVRNDGKKYGIFVRWGAGKTDKPTEVIVENNIRLLHGMGIRPYKPGKAKTALWQRIFRVYQR